MSRLNNLLVLSQSNALDLGLEVQLADALHLGVVPEHDLVRGELGLVTTAHQGNDVGPVQELHNANASVKLYLVL